MSTEPLTVSRVAVTKLAVYYRVASGNADRGVSVRVGDHGKFCCLTCLTINCRHALAAMDYEHAHPLLEQTHATPF